MRHGNGVQDRDDKSIGIDILMTEAFAKINPTDPLRLSKQAARRKWNSSGSSWKPILHGESMQKKLW